MSCLPEDLATVYKLYHPFVADGKWTFGLIEMWWPKAKAVKRNVHIPCWDSFKWNPFLWRGICFGRSPEQCYWTGLRQTRWARAVYAANLGREYVMPVIDISQRGGGFKSDIKALCWMYFILGTVASCGIGQIFSLGGNFLCNFGAIYSCHAREKLRRKYKLPAMFGLPPGLDDCLVHFICFYCASHQEIRELAVRGVDGPGMHIMDVLPHSWDHIPGHEKVRENRQAIVAQMLAHPPRLFKPRIKTAVEAGPAAQALLIAKAAGMPLTPLAAGVHAVPAGGAGGGAGAALASRTASSAASEGDMNFGWMRYKAPAQQEMGRGAPDVGRGVPDLRSQLGVGTHSVSVARLDQPPPAHSADAGAAPPPLQRAWSLAY
ncbi:hypothetical protein N2152v2_001627 [Parachlorella kessleri]